MLGKRGVVIIGRGFELRLHVVKLHAHGVGLSLNVA